MQRKRNWKEIMKSDEAKSVRESADNTFKLRRRAWKDMNQDGNRSDVRKASEVQVISWQDKSTTALLTQAAQAGSDQIVASRDAYSMTLNNDQRRFNNVTSLQDHTLSRLSSLPSVEYIWWDRNPPLENHDLGSDMKRLTTFVDVIFPLQFGFYGLSRNTDRTWLFRTLVDTKPLYQASLTVTLSFESVMQDFNRTRDTVLHADARSLQVEALRGLQLRVDELNNEKYQGEELIRKGMQVLAIMTQLLSLEVFSFFEGQWEMHWQASRIILGLFQKKWAPTLFTDMGTSSIDSPIEDIQAHQYHSDDLRALNFFITGFVWVDVIANATFGPPVFNPYHFDYLPLLRSGYLKPQEMMGCQNSILSSIAEITALESWKNAQTKKDSLSLIELVSRAAAISAPLDRNIKALECKLCINPTNLRADSEAINLIFAYAGLVYLSLTVSGSSIHISETRDNATRCLERLEALPPRLLLRSCWPFTIAGCMAAKEQYGRFRDLVKRAAAAKQPLGTVWKGLKVMEECWRLRGGEGGTWCLRSTMERMGKKILLI
jgi:hypothetical protein